MSAYSQSLAVSLFTLLLLSSSVIRFSEASNGVQMMESTMEPVKMVEMRLMLNDSRRRLNSFQMCALCTCCGGGASKRYCLPSPCCYAINCNIPNRPFGYCSFTPKACNCFGCHL